MQSRIEKNRAKHPRWRVLQKKLTASSWLQGSKYASDIRQPPFSLKKLHEGYDLMAKNQSTDKISKCNFMVECLKVH